MEKLSFLPQLHSGGRPAGSQYNPLFDIEVLQENREKILEIKKALWNKHDRLKQIDPNLKDPRLLGSKIQLKEFSQKKLEEIEKVLMEDWTVEGQQ